MLFSQPTSSICSQSSMAMVVRRFVRPLAASTPTHPRSCARAFINSLLLDPQVAQFCERHIAELVVASPNYQAGKYGAALADGFRRCVPSSIPPSASVSLPS